MSTILFKIDAKKKNKFKFTINPNNKPVFKRMADIKLLL